MSPARRLLLGGALLLLGTVAAACQAAGGGGEATIAPVRIPFGCGERASYELRELDGTRVAGALFEVRCESDRLLLEQSFRGPGPTGDGGAGPRDRSLAVVESGTLHPVASSREATRDGETTTWSAVYTADLTSVGFRQEESGDDAEERELRLRRGAYDNESALWLWRALELAEGYDGQYVSVSAVSQSQITVRLTVAREERVEVPAGDFETWRIHVRSGRATRVAWIAVDTPHQLVQWDNGSEIFRLVEYEAGSSQ